MTKAEVQTEITNSIKANGTKSINGQKLQSVLLTMTEQDSDEPKRLCYVTDSSCKFALSVSTSKITILGINREIAEAILSRTYVLNHCIVYADDTRQQYTIKDSAIQYVSIIALGDNKYKAELSIIQDSMIHTLLESFKASIDSDINVFQFARFDLIQASF